MTKICGLKLRLMAANTCLWVLSDAVVLLLILLYQIFRNLSIKSIEFQPASNQRQLLQTKTLIKIKRYPMRSWAIGCKRRLRGLFLKLIKSNISSFSRTKRFKTMIRTIS
jgi:hypothetical protein